MSFILDALRKSEHARQHLGGATLAELPLARRPRSQPWWVIALAVLLLVNLVILTLVLLRKTPQPEATLQAPSSAVMPPPVATATSAAIQAADRTPAPLSEEAAPPPAVEYETIPRDQAPLDVGVPDGPRLVRPAEKTTNAPEPPIALTTNGLPELHLDMHVYAKNPKDRFVFINMRKYAEGQTLKEGPRIDEITANGVTLYYKGQTLALPRP